MFPQQNGLEPVMCTSYNFACQEGGYYLLKANKNGLQLEDNKEQCFIISDKSPFILKQCQYLINEFKYYVITNADGDLALYYDNKVKHEFEMRTFSEDMITDDTSNFLLAVGGGSDVCTFTNKVCLLKGLIIYMNL